MCRKPPEPSSITSGTATMSLASEAYKSEQQPFPSQSKTCPKIAVLLHELQTQLKITDPTILGMFLL